MSNHGQYQDNRGRNRNSGRADSVYSDVFNQVAFLKGEEIQSNRNSSSSSYSQKCILDKDTATEIYIDHDSECDNMVYEMYDPQFD